MSTPPFILFLFLLLPNHAQSQSKSESPTYFIEVCRPAFGNYSLNSTYQSNLLSLLSDLHAAASTNQSSSAAHGQPPDTVYGDYYCRADISIDLCTTCVKSAGETLIKNCSSSRAAVMWFVECTLRYSNESAAGIESEWPRSWWSSARNISDSQFSTLLGATVDSVIGKAVQIGNFATEEKRVSRNETLYALAQCRPELNGTECGTCLRSAFGFLPACCGNSSAWAYVFYPVCQLRYDTRRFYHLQASPSPEFAPPPPVLK